MIILRKKSFSDDYKSDFTEGYRAPEVETHTISDNRSAASLEFYKENNPNIEVYSTDIRESGTSDPVFDSPLSSDAMIN